MGTFLVFTASYGILRKADTNVKAARLWARKAFPAGEVVSVIREHQTGTPVAQLEVEYRAMRRFHNRHED